ncbi:hypothetical protein HGM15179_011013 [Zosterops borbonicus]|uniref:Uncharacterized protein n=1 Tax=Zosterops borbonicus TaxID=364589 RepID=A0A8K1GCD5_9PASS|nr:hypothetical protein HGM15179_011012 [Zosterops borbonicus]TRZ16081.1 hypothetical protein HGM15179_011013 [Zosterops borbonicus]
MDDCKLFRRDRQETRGCGLVLCVKEGNDYLELDDGDGTVEYFWVRVRRNANKTDILEGVYYRLPKKTEEAEKILYKKVSQLLILLMRDLNFTDIHWKCNTVEREHSISFLECVERNCLMQMMREAAREGSSLDRMAAGH